MSLTPPPPVSERVPLVVVVGQVVVVRLVVVEAAAVVRVVVGAAVHVGAVVREVVLTDCWTAVAVAVEAVPVVGPSRKVLVTTTPAELQMVPTPVCCHPLHTLLAPPGFVAPAPAPVRVPVRVPAPAPVPARVPVRVPVLPVADGPRLRGLSASVARPRRKRSVTWGSTSTSGPSVVLHLHLAEGARRRWVRGDHRWVRRLP